MSISIESEQKYGVSRFGSAKFIIEYGYVFVAFIPPILAIWYVEAANVNVVFSDLWGHMHMVDDFLVGNLRPVELFVPHNQNRPIVLNVFLLISAQFDHFMVKNLIYIFLIFQLISYFALLFMLKSANLSKANSQIAVVVLSFLLFSLGQWENYTLAINLVFASTVAFSLLAILAWQSHLSASRGFINLGLTLVLAELATYSMGGGVVIWAVLPIQALLYGMRGPTAKPVSFALLLVAAAISIVVYGRGLPHPVSPQSIVQQLSDPLRSIQFILIEFGSSILGALNNAPVINLDFAIGSVVVAFYLLATVAFFQMSAKERRDRLPIASVMLFALGELALIWLGRGQGELQDAASSRYMTLTNVGLAAVLLLIASRAQNSKVFRAAFFLGCTVCLVATIASDRSEMRMAKYRKGYQKNLRVILEDGVFGDEQLKALQWSVRDDVVDGVATLKKYRLGQFRK